MNLSPGYILMFLLSGALTIWGLWVAFDSRDPPAVVAWGMVAVGGVGCALSLLPLRDGTAVRLRRIQRMQQDGLLDDEQAVALREQILAAA